MNSIESLLERNLGPTRAPGELWDRVNQPHRPTARSDRRIVWAAVAAAVVVGLWSFGRLDAIRSNEPAAIRNWVKARTGIEIPLVDGCGVVGARARPGRVEVAYRAAGHEIALSVAKAAGPDQPAHWGRKSYSGKDAVSWTMGGQVYTLACASPAELEAGCRLCHVDPVLN